MNFHIFISASGLEALAHGEAIYNWHLTVRRESKSLNDGYTLIESLNWEPPPREQAVTTAANKLEEERKAAARIFYLADKDYQDRTNDLLMLSFEAKEDKS